MSSSFIYKDEFIQFIGKASPQLIYPQPAFLKFLQDTVGGELRGIFHYEGKSLAGFFPFFRIEKEAGVIINSLPWFGSHGGCYVASHADPRGTRDQLLLHFKEQLASESKLISATISLSPFENCYLDTYHEVFNTATTEERSGQVLTLPSMPNATLQEVGARLMNMMLQKSRNCLRKGMKQGFEFVTDSSNEAWEYLYTTHKENMLAIGGTPKQLQAFESLRAQCSNDGVLSLALLEGKPVAGMFCLYHKPHVEYFIPVISREFRSLQPLSYLLHMTMIKAVQDGFLYWNFGGTGRTQESLHRFKAGWGASDFSYSYIIVPGNHGKLHDSEWLRRMMVEYPSYYIYPLG